MMLFDCDSSQRRCIFLLSMFLGTIGGHAAAADENGAYVGGSVGRARNGYDTHSIDATLTSDATAAGDTLDITKRSTSRLSDAWSVDAGYFFNPYIGLEAAFLHVGEVRYIAVGTTIAPGASLAVASSTEVTSHGPAFSVVLRLPLVESLEADLKLGDYFGRTTFDNDTIVGASGGFLGPARSSSSLLASIGIAYTVAGHYSFRVDYLRIQRTGNDEDTGVKFNVDLVMAGLSYSF